MKHETVVPFRYGSGGSVSIHSGWKTLPEFPTATKRLQWLQAHIAGWIPHVYVHYS